MKILSYDYLPKEAFEIRGKVFMDEQGFVDEIDKTDSIATHFLVFEDDKAVATCRVFEKDGNFHLGRFAVLKEYRNRGVGRQLLLFAEQKVFKMGGSSLLLHSQLRAKEFYKKCGYTAFGEVELEENYPHIWMKKFLN